MNILFFLSHPAHYYLFKNTISITSKSHNVYVIIKSKDVLENILSNDGVDFFNIQRKSLKRNNKLKILIGSFVGLLIRSLRLLKFVYKNKIDLMLGTEWAITLVGKIANVPSVVFNEDDTLATPENKYFYPWASYLFLPSCCDQGLWQNKRITYDGYHELAYLVPNRFKPDKSIVTSTIDAGKEYVIIRLVKLSASHDMNKSGLSNELVDKVIDRISSKYKIYINSEKQLPAQYDKYRLNIAPHNMHHFLFYATMFIGDSQTMTAEAAVLGVPSIRFNDFVGKLSYLEELEHKYGLTYGIKTSEPEKLFQKIDELLAMPNLKEEWQKRRMKMLSEKIDVTAFMVWFIENYPESVKVMRENPGYQERFK